MLYIEKLFPSNTNKIFNLLKSRKPVHASSPFKNEELRSRRLTKKRKQRYCSGDASLTSLNFENTQQEVESLVDEDASKSNHDQTQEESYQRDLVAEGIKLHHTTKNSID